MCYKLAKRKIDASYIISRQKQSDSFQIQGGIWVPNVKNLNLKKVSNSED